jgi:hypothetical protein
MKHDSNILTLDRDALSKALAENLEEYGLESVEDYKLDAFSDNACRAIADLTTRRWMCGLAFARPFARTARWWSTRWTPSMRTAFS